MDNARLRLGSFVVIVLLALVLVGDIAFLAGMAHEMLRS
jgi:hypothetical protein